MTGRNVYWKRILIHDKVIDKETHWEVVDRNGVNQGVVYWEGQEAKEAQDFLKRRTLHYKKFG